ncbi:hypothetical protein [Empedobacter stercoris]|uniref:hypothetical protein n=1 Tax=Empedobacter stercoris TaxID=1628248 RepID=UPI0039EB1D34
MNSKRIIKFVTILIIFIIQFLFLFSIINERIEHDLVPYIIVAICLLLLIVYRKFPLHHHEYSFDRKTLVLWIPIAAIITYLMNNKLGLGAVFSAGIIGTLGSFLTKLNPRSDYLKQVAGPIYCGAFIGMTSLDVEYVYWMIITAGIFTALLFFATKSLFVGVGGKLGTLAFIGVLLSMLLYKLILG